MIVRSIPNLEGIVIGLNIAKPWSGHQEMDLLKLRSGSGFPEELSDRWS